MRLSWGERDGRVCLVVGPEARGGGAERFAVYLAEIVPERERPEGLQPMAGTYVREPEGVVFVPRFPFQDGRSYVVFDEDGDEEPGELTRPPARGEPSTVVTGIFPCVAEVPVNLLKIYVEFSAPMSEGFVEQGIEVLDGETGKRLTDVFRSDPELWDRGHRRLTLLLDPARIKRGLINNLEAGYPLRECGSVVVSATPQMEDANGQPLLTTASRRYRVGPELRGRVDPRAWRADAPRAGTYEPVDLAFDRPLDHALLGRCIRVVGPDGHAVEGRVEVSEDDCRWALHPAAPWAAGRYLIEVDGRLEDLAGNSAVRVFDRDLDRRTDDPTERVAPLEFDVSGG